MNALPDRPRGWWGISDHARERLLERYGFEATREEWIAALASIEAGRALLVRRLPARRLLVLVRLVGREVLVGYDTLTHVIITTYPPDARRTCFSRHKRPRRPARLKREAEE